MNGEYEKMLQREKQAGQIMRNVLLPFLEYSVFFGTGQLESAGEITLTGFVKDGDNVVTIENNGPGVEYAEVPMEGEGHFIQMSMREPL